MDLVLLAVIAAVVVVALAIGLWQVFAIRRVVIARDAIQATRSQLEAARRSRDAVGASGSSSTSSPAEVARLDDEVQRGRREVNAAVREGEALRKRFPTSLYASRIPEPQYEESQGGTAEPPRIAF